MLIVLPSDPTTTLASQFLTTQGVDHTVVPIPTSLNYRNAANCALYLPEPVLHPDVPMQLTKAKFVVMRVFKGYTQDDAH
jgi:hypothetical protein